MNILRNRYLEGTLNNIIHDSANENSRLLIWALYSSILVNFVDWKQNSS